MEKIVIVDISQCFLRNQRLENNPQPQYESEIFKSVLESLREKGMVNPLMGVEENGRYKICVGNNRYLAAKILGIEKVKILVVPNDSVETLRAHYKYYEDIDNFFIPKYKESL